MEKTVVPKLLQILYEIFCGGYFRRWFTVEKILVIRYYWPKMFNDTFNYRKCYEVCQIFANKFTVSDNLYLIFLSGPFEKCDIDLMNLLLVTNK